MSETRFKRNVYWIQVLTITVVPTDSVHNLKDLHHHKNLILHSSPVSQLYMSTSISPVLCHLKYHPHRHLPNWHATQHNYESRHTDTASPWCMPLRQCWPHTALLSGTVPLAMRAQMEPHCWWHYHLLTWCPPQGPSQSHHHLSTAINNVNKFFQTAGNKSKKSKRYTHDYISESSTFSSALHRPMLICFIYVTMLSIFKWSSAGLKMRKTTNNLMTATTCLRFQPGTYEIKYIVLTIQLWHLI